MRRTLPARQALTYLLRYPDPQLPLAEAVMCVAWEDQGGDDPRTELRQIDQMAEALRPRLVGQHDPNAVVATLNRYFFDELGFGGNPDCYLDPDPRHSFLDLALQRRTGLPIILALIYLEVGWRLALPLGGLGLPGHFIVRYRSPDADIFIDPFNRGRLWSYDDCERQIDAIYGESPPDLVNELMQPPTRRSILIRILRNLKHTYLAREEFDHALASVERLILLDRDDLFEVRDRGLLRIQIGDSYAALEDLERYVRLRPNAHDVAELQSFARIIANSIARTN